jgi:hypothetical protein
LVVESSKPKPIDWTPTFLDYDKIPWGTYVLHNELPAFFPDSEIKNIDITAFEKFYLNNDLYTNTTYLYVDKHVKIDLPSQKDLLAFVSDGNKVFITSEFFPYYLLDSLNVSVNHKDYSDFDFKNDTLNKPMYLTHDKLKDKYEYGKGFDRYYFDEFETNKTQVLGFFDFDEEQYINYISISHGKGTFYLHTQPYAFTNFHLLKDNHAKYVSDVFSYLDNTTIFWDKINKSNDGNGNSDLRYILSQPPLRYAWHWAIVGLLLFIFFTARRRQRIVPTIKELPNTSVAFAKTIGDLYYQEGQPKDIINKMITFFLEKIRKNYMLDTQNLNTLFTKRLHQKSGVPLEQVEQLINYIVFLNNKKDINEVSLVSLNKMIDLFYKKSGI